MALSSQHLSSLRFSTPIEGGMEPHAIPEELPELDANPPLELLPALDDADAEAEVEEDEPDEDEAPRASLGAELPTTDDPLKLYVRQIGDGRLLAVERAGQDPGRGGLAAAAGAGEQVGVVHPVARESRPKRLGHVVLPDDLGKGLGAVAPVEREG